MGQSFGKSIVRRSPSSCPGPNNLPPLQFHPVHGDNIRLSRDGTLARRFESFCRAITFSARPVRINERICIKFAEISNNWNGGIRFGFTTNDPATLENALPKYACPDLTNRPGFWAKALHEQYCEKDNILYYYVNTAGDVIYGINNEEKGVILSGIDTRGLLWTIIDIYGNCTAIEFLDARIYMYQQSGMILSSMHNGMHQIQQQHQQQPQQQQTQQHIARRALPVVTTANTQTTTNTALAAEQDMLNSMQTLHLTAADQTALASDLANGLPPLRYNAQGRLIPVPFHITKGRNVRLSHDRFIASRTESDFCQGYVFTARPIRIGEKLIVQVLKTEQMYVGALALGLTSCNPATLQANDLPNDSDFLLDRPEYWVVSKDIASAPQRCDEIAFFVAPNGEVTISKNNGAAVTVMHVDQSLQLWAFLDVYGSTQSVRMFRQQLPNMIAYPQLSAASSSRVVNMPVSESLNSLNSQMSEARKLLHPAQLNVTHSSISSSSNTLASLQTTAATGGGRMISVPSNGDILQIQPNGGGTVLVVNLPAASSPLCNNELNQARVTNAALNAACSSATIVSNGSSQYIEPISCNTNGSNVVVNGHATSTTQQTQQKRKDVVDHQHAVEQQANTTSNSNSAECTICYENPIDSVLYMCGHMCMCYDCAIEQWRGVGFGQCPLCRAVIRDVIRTYTT